MGKNIGKVTFMTRFQPILLGSDINVYGMARAFHEEYGIVSDAYAYFQLSPTKFSKIVNVHIVDDFNNFVTFRDFMLDLGKRMKAEDPDRVLLLIPCGDVYANLLSQCGDDLRKYFVYNTLDINLSRRLAYKSTFYQICEQYDLPHPKTKTVTADELSDRPLIAKISQYTDNSYIGIAGLKGGFGDIAGSLDTLTQNTVRTGDDIQGLLDQAESSISGYLDEYAE